MGTPVTEPGATTPVALYLQDAHPLREGMELARYAEERGFRAVWQAESRLVREATPDALLAHFVHIPWPQADAWRVLAEHQRRAVHHGLLANDLVGFHTERWRENFARSCIDVLGARRPDDDVLGYEGRSVLCVAHPISIDVGEFEELAESEPVLAAERALVEERPERLVLRVDRTDPSKNVVRGFRAFEAYLDAHPEAHGRVVMLALLDPSRQDIPEYVEYLAAIERTAAEVNERFLEGDWAPIRLEVEDDFHRALAAYKQFDVLLTNAVYDGLNLVAKEAMLVNRRDGVLVLSENVGAHEELGEWALSVNPFDVSGQAEAIHRALELPHEERRRRFEAIRAQVREHDVAAWLEAQLSVIDWAAARVPSRSLRNDVLGGIGATTRALRQLTRELQGPQIQHPPAAAAACRGGFAPAVGLGLTLPAIAATSTTRGSNTR